MEFDFSKVTLKPTTQQKLEDYQKEIQNRIQIQQISDSTTSTEPSIKKEGSKTAIKAKVEKVNSKEVHKIDLSKNSFNPGITVPLYRRSIGLQQKEPVFVPWKAMDRHAFICGSTGSGKTVFLKSLLEQAAMYEIPSLVFDPGGDLGYLALRTPLLQGESDLAKVTPIIAEKVFTSESKERGDQLVKDLVEQDGIKKNGGIHKGYIDQLESKTCVRIISPRSIKHGIPISIPPFNQDSLQILENETEGEYDDRLDEIVTTLFSSLHISGSRADRTGTVLKLLMKEICGDLGTKPLDSLLDHWANVEKKVPNVLRLSLAEFLKKDDKVEFQRSLTSFLLGIGAGWLRGCKLDFDLLFQKVEGKTPINVLYVGHLSLEEQQYVLARVSSELDKWMRTGTTSQDKLKALFAIDELGGSGGKESFFPPAAKPVSKPPLMRLVRQARKYGCGLVFATQNVKDIDYRGLGNISNWFVGQLKNAREHNYIGDGMGSSMTDGSQLDKREITHLLPTLKQGMFINVGADGMAQTLQAGFIGSLHLRPSQEFYEAWLSNFIEDSKKAAFDYLNGKKSAENMHYAGFGYYENALLEFLQDENIKQANHYKAWEYIISHSLEHEKKFTEWLWNARDKMSDAKVLEFCKIEIQTEEGKAEVNKIKALSLITSDQTVESNKEEIPTFHKDPLWKKFVSFLLNWKLPKEEIEQWKIKTDTETVRLETNVLKQEKPVETPFTRKRELRKFFSEHIENLDKEFLAELFQKSTKQPNEKLVRQNLKAEELLKELATSSKELVFDLGLRKACHEYINSLSPDGFEFFIADLMKQFGWKAQLTRASGDDGVDVLCENDDGVRCAVQCKRYSKKVGVSAVRDLEGAKKMYDCQEAILATSDSFTQSSKDTAKKLKITLIDGDLLAFHAIPFL